MDTPAVERGAAASTVGSGSFVGALALAGKVGRSSVKLSALKRPNPSETFTSPNRSKKPVDLANSMGFDSL
jgi:hypothetical protein